MSLLALALMDPNDPYIACTYGIMSHPLYLKCAECPHKDFCDYGVSSLASKELEEILKTFDDNEVSS